MSTSVSLMVRPTTLPDTPVKFLLEQNGIWRDMGGSDRDVSLTDIRDRTRTRLKYLMEVIEAGPPNNWDAAASNWYAELYEPLIPEKLRVLLKTAADQAPAGDPPTLRIHIDVASLDWIPWELMHDGTDFLGLRFQIARLPIMPTGPDLSQPARSVQRIYSVLGANVLTNALLPDWQTTFSSIIAAPVQEVQFPASNAIPAAPISWPSQMDVKLTIEGDIVHFTCHGGFEDGGSSYWTLDHQKNALPWVRIDPNLLKALDFSAKRPLVFGNACSSAAGPSNGSTGMITGFGPLFFARGALAFIGTFAPIRKELAIDFARRFYRHLLQDGLPVGLALWTTKHYYQQRAKMDSTQQVDPSWLFYCLYGPPETHFTLSV